MKNFTLLSITFVLILSSCVDGVPPIPVTPPGELTEDGKILVASLDEFIKPLVTTDPSIPADDLDFLSDLGTKKIVGIGEATHGTREFYTTKQRVFEYLVENHGFKNLVFEIEFGEALDIDRYVYLGEGDINVLMLNMVYWNWKTQEISNLINWMRTYNEGKPMEDRLRFFGMDCSNFDNNCNRLIRDLLTYDDELTNGIIDRFNFCDIIDVYGSYSPQTRIEIIQSYQDLIQELDDQESDYVALMGDSEYQLFRQQIVNILYGVYILETEFGETTFLTREEGLIANTIWVNDFVGPDEKTAVWAHNVHIARDPSFEAGISLGQGIYDKIGDDYANIATTFTRGNFNAFNPEFGIIEFSLVTPPANNSVNFIFSFAQYDNFILKVKDVVAIPIWEDFFSSQRSILQIGTNYDNQPAKYYINSDLQSEYDYFINIDLTTSSRLLN